MTRASDDALVSFRRDAAHSSVDDDFDPDESFDAHDRARGIGPRASGGIAGAGGASGTAAGEARYSRTSESGGRGGRAGRTTSRSRLPGPVDEAAATGAADSGVTDSSRSAGKARDDGRETAARRTTSQRPARSLKGRALGYLSRREYSRAELARKLTPYVEETDDPEALLDWLEREGWLSDARFTESLVHRRASRVGTARILGELKRHAVDSTLVEAVTDQLRESELSRAQAVWRKKFGTLPITPAERAKQARFLASRGFSGATVAKILKGDIDEFDCE